MVEILKSLYIYVYIKLYNFSSNHPHR